MRYALVMINILGLLTVMAGSWLISELTVQALQRSHTVQPLLVSGSLG